MEPHKDDLEQTLQPRPEEKKRRFRLVKLEERLAPVNIGPPSLPTTGTHCTHYSCHGGSHYK